MDRNPGRATVAPDRARPRPGSTPDLPTISFGWSDRHHRSLAHAYAARV